MKKLLKIIFLPLLIAIPHAFSQSYQLGSTDSLKTFINYIAIQNPKEQFSNNSEITKVLRLLREGELRLVRNTLFARYGYNFDSQDLQAFFKEFQWYQPRTKEITLDEIDKLNIELIKSLEEAEQKRFNEFLSFFETNNLPLMISKDNRLSPSYKEKGLDGSLVSKYLSPSKSLYNRLQAYLPPQAGKYHGWFKIIRSEFIVVCYLHALPAGGYLDIYNLTTFTSQGDVISKERIAVYAGEATEEALSNTIITTTLEIQIEDIDIKFDDLEKEKSREIEIRKYQVTEQGRIDLILVKHGS